MNANGLIADNLNNAGHWFVDHQDILVQYCVNIVAAAMIIILGFIFARLLANAFSHMLERKKVDPTVTGFLHSLIRYSIIIFAGIAALNRIGVQTSSVIAVLGAASLAVGLALQGSLSNFAAGVLIVLFRPFRKGDFVDMAGVSGVVHSIQIFSTVLNTGDKKTIVIPNSSIMAGRIINYSLEPERRIDLTISVGYEADIDHVKKVLNEVVMADPRVNKDKACTIRLMTMGASSLDFVVRPWVKNAEYWDVYFDLMENIKKALDEAKINIPYPQMDVHMVKAD